MRLYVFLGPTLSLRAAKAIAPSATFLPPVRHGDVLITPFQRGDLALIVDGYFHQDASIRHKEILHLLGHGVRVWGASSMGALRAAELDGLGMQGIGWVYRQYATQAVIADDAVALLHDDEDNCYRPVTVPLANMLYALEIAVGRQVVGSAFAELCKSVAWSLHYSERTWRKVVDLAAAERPDQVGDAGRLMALLKRAPRAVDAKGNDARSALRAATFALAAARTPEIPWAARSYSAPEVLRDWLAEAPRRSLHGVPVANAHIMRYTQFFHPEARSIWSDIALTYLSSRLGQQGMPTPATTRRSADVDGSNGRWTDGCPGASPEPCLPRGETDSKLVRLLARRMPLHVKVDEYSKAIDESPALVSAVAVAMAGAEAARQAFHYDATAIGVNTILSVLARLWDISGGNSDERLEKEALSRGFASLEGAARDFRPFAVAHRLGWLDDHGNVRRDLVAH